jgi:hypothetical protein
VEDLCLHNLLQDLGAYGKMILKLTFKNRMDMEWIDPAQDVNQWRDLVNTVNLSVP